ESGERRGIEPDRLAEIGNRTVVVALVAVRRAAVVEGAGEILRLCIFRLDHCRAADDQLLVRHAALEAGPTFVGNLAKAGCRLQRRGRQQKPAENLPTLGRHARPPWVFTAAPWPPFYTSGRLFTTGTFTAEL